MDSIYGHGWVIDAQEVVDMEVAENLVIVKDQKLKSTIVKVRNKKNSPEDVLADLMTLDMLTCKLVLVHALRL